MKNLGLMSKYVLGRIRRLYFMALPETEDDLRNSRIRFALGEASANSLDQMTGGIYIVSLMAFLGISDANIGIFISLASLTSISQIFTIKLLKNMKKTKLFICATNIFRLGLSSLYFIPLFDMPLDVRVFMFVATYFVSKLFIQIAGPANQEWIASLVPQFSRGRYFSLKDIGNGATAAVFLMIAGVIIDKYQGEEQTKAFIILGIIATSLAIVAFTLFTLVNESKKGIVDEQGRELHGRLAERAEKKAIEKGEVKEKGSVLKDFKNCFACPKFRKAFFMEMLWMITFFMASPFNGSYVVKELNMSFTFLSILTLVTTAIRMFISPQMGKLGDRIGMAKTVKYAFLMYGMNCLVVAFTVPSNAVPMQILAALCGTFAWSFIGAGMFNVKLELLGNENRMVKLAVGSSIIGIAGFTTSFIAGKVLDFLQKNPVSLFGRELYAQQVLNFCSFLSALVLFFYIRQVLEKEKVEISETDGKIV